VEFGSTVAAFYRVGGGRRWLVEGGQWGLAVAGLDSYDCTGYGSWRWGETEEEQTKRTAMPFQWNGGAREVNSGVTVWGWRWAGAVGQRWAKRLRGLEWNWAWAGEKKKENRAYFGLGQIDSRAEMDRIIGMVAEIDFELIQGFLEFKSKALTFSNRIWIGFKIG
jgi:hypothetical protein